MASKSLRMEINMKESGKKIKQMEKASFGTLTETIMKGSGRTIWLMEEDSTLRPTGQAISANGKMTCSTDTVRRPGLTSHHSKESITREPNTARASTTTPTAQSTMASGSTTKSTESVPTPGKTRKYIKDSGKMEICVDKEYLCGLMAVATKANT
jgi:hypothetical protein